MYIKLLGVILPTNLNMEIRDRFLGYIPTLSHITSPRDDPLIDFV